MPELLHEHLRRNIVRSGGVYLLQTVGIPQGSVLSTLLCGVFYAHLAGTLHHTRSHVPHSLARSTLTHIRDCLIMEYPVHANGGRPLTPRFTPPPPFTRHCFKGASLTPPTSNPPYYN